MQEYMRDMSGDRTEYGVGKRMERWYEYLDGRFKKCKEAAFIIFPQINESHPTVQNIPLLLLSL